MLSCNAILYDFSGYARVVFDLFIQGGVRLSLIRSFELTHLDSRYELIKDGKIDGKDTYVLRLCGKLLSSSEAQCLLEKLQHKETTTVGGDFNRRVKINNIKVVRVDV